MLDPDRFALAKLSFVDGLSPAINDGRNRRSNMTHRLTSVVALCTFLLAISALSRAATDSTGTNGTRVSSPRLLASNPQAVPKKGRYKAEGANCIWDVNDAGPNQCTPLTRGRFKKGGDGSCAWNATDSGPDQCTPPAGRWKTAGSRCVWDPTDAGPNQCNPRQARKARR